MDDDLLVFLVGGSVCSLVTAAFMWARFEALRIRAETRALSAMKEYQLLSIKNANDYAVKVERVCYDYAGFVEELANTGALSGQVPPLRESVVVDGDEKKAVVAGR